MVSIKSGNSLLANDSKRFTYQMVPLREVQTASTGGKFVTEMLRSSMIDYVLLLIIIMNIPYSRLDTNLLATNELFSHL